MVGDAKRYYSITFTLLIALNADNKPMAQTCPRCLSKLDYLGRPCFICLSPAIHTFRQSEIRNLAGDARSKSSITAPKKLNLRGKVKMPKRRLTLATVRRITRWTWNSIGIAAMAHLLFFAVAFFFKDDISVLIDNVTTVESVEQVSAIPAPTAAEPKPELPELKALDEHVSVSDLVEDMPEDLGDQIELPPEDIFVPMPEDDLVRPNKPTQFLERILNPKANSGLGGGEVSPSSPKAPSGSGLFKNRTGTTRKAALRLYGGGEKTEGAVNLGLEYLASKQRGTGYWRVRDGFENGRSHDTGEYRTCITALCTLPFLAAGNSPDEGKYRKNVQRAIKYLIRHQTSDGCVVDSSSQMYGHSVSTLALCEAYGLTGDKNILKAAERAIRFLERTQNTGGGWDYIGRYGTSSKNSRAQERNDLSISGWGVLAFKSARAAGIAVNNHSWKKLTDLYNRLSLSTGETYYADEASGILNANRKGIGMVGVGLTARVALDADAFRRRNNAAENLLLNDLPEYDKFLKPNRTVNSPNFHTFYGWYYGTLGMFLHTKGKGASWKIWNDKLKGSLLENQILSGERKGSWHHDDSWIGPYMGDLYSTACAVLCLEIYYRYNPSHNHQEDIDLKRTSSKPKKRPTRPVEIDGQTLDLDISGQRSKYLHLKVKKEGLGALPLLLSYLKDESPSVRSTSLFELGRLKAKDAAEPVGLMLSDIQNRDLRTTIIYTLGQIGDSAQSARLIKLLNDGDKSVVQAARHSLGKLSGGKDFGINKRAWHDYFGRAG